MSKYSTLTDHLAAQASDRVPMTFDQIERLLGFPLPPSAHRHRAWWSNNTENNVMTRAWREAGFLTEQVDLGGGRLVFRRESAGAPAPGMAEAAAAFVGPQVERIDHPAFGCMAGTVTFVDGVDLTEPADPGWADVIEQVDR